jgi:hypothetical protein
MSSPSPGTEPIADDEVLYRRIPVSTDWYAGGVVSPDAFHPRNDEFTGISISRAKYYESVTVAARGPSKRGYYVASLRASQLREHGIEPVPRPILDSDPPDPGHAELPCLTAGNRRTDQALEYKLRLASLCFEIQGPFPPIAS